MLKEPFLVEYARESENMRKRNAELEVMLNVQKELSAEPQGELISREDAIKVIADMICDNKWVCECAISSLPTAEAEDRHYIKIYADDDPSVKAEKLYQICDETQNREVAEWLKEYFPSTDDNWIPVSESLPKCGIGMHYLVTLKDGHCFRDDVYEAFFDKNGWHMGYNELSDDDVIAWMPLPTPYKGGDTE